MHDKDIKPKPSLIDALLESLAMKLVEVIFNTNNRDKLLSILERVESEYNPPSNSTVVSVFKSIRKLFVDDKEDQLAHFRTQLNALKLKEDTSLKLNESLALFKAESNTELEKELQSFFFYGKWKYNVLFATKLIETVTEYDLGSLSEYGQPTKIIERLCDLMLLNMHPVVQQNIQSAREKHKKGQELKILQAKAKSDLLPNADVHFASVAEKKVLLAKLQVVKKSYNPGDKTPIEKNAELNKAKNILADNILLRRNGGNVKAIEIQNKSVNQMENVPEEVQPALAEVRVLPKIGHERRALQTSKKNKAFGKAAGVLSMFFSQSQPEVVEKFLAETEFVKPEEQYAFRRGKIQPIDGYIKEENPDIRDDIVNEVDTNINDENFQFSDSSTATSSISVRPEKSFLEISNLSASEPLLLFGKNLETFKKMSERLATSENLTSALNKHVIKPT